MIKSINTTIKGFGWQFVTPVVVSVLWLALITLFLYLEFKSIESIFDQKFNELGDFFAGAFAPLATFWLVYAVLIQSRQLKMQAIELQLQREELTETRKTLEAQRVEMAEAAKQAKVQAIAVQATSGHQSRHTFAQISIIIERDILYYASNILAKIIGGKQTMVALKNKLNGNEYAVFNILSSSLAESKNNREILKNMEKVHLNSVQNFRYSFENLLIEVDRCDDEMKRLRKLYEHSPMGYAYATITKIIELDSQIQFVKHEFKFKE
jgi:hypothetical protein